MAGLLVVPGASKFVTDGTSVRFFDSLGLASPEILVPIVGGLEFLAVGLLLLDDVPRVAAPIAVPIMAVVIATAGPSWQTVGVLVAAFGLLTIDTLGGRAADD